MNKFLAHNDKIRREMLQQISKSSLEDLFVQVPVKCKNFSVGNSECGILFYSGISQKKQGRS